MLLATVCFVIVAIQCQVDFAFGASRRPSSDDKITYPGPINDVYSGNGRFDDDMPDECKGGTYCSVKAKNYPEEQYNNLLKDKKPFFPPPELLPITLNNRQGDPSETNDCQADIRFEPVYHVRNSPSEPWRNVIQAPELNYVQKVRLETCKNGRASNEPFKDGEEVNECFKILPPTAGYNTFCKQIINTWVFHVDDGKNGTTTFVKDLPVCCTCVYKPNADLLNRFGKPKSKGLD